MMHEAGFFEPDGDALMPIPDARGPWAEDMMHGRLLAELDSTGYMDADELIPGLWRRLGLFASAVTVAGAQAGGLMPDSTAQWLGFAALLAANFGLQSVVAHITEQEEQRSREREG